VAPESSQDGVDVPDDVEALLLGTKSSDALISFRQREVRPYLAHQNPPPLGPCSTTMPRALRCS